MLITLPQAVELLQTHQVVAFPTETVYGLGALATSEEAIEKVFIAKNRPKDNPLICHFYSLDQIKEYVPNLPDYVEILAQSFWPGPLSLLIKMPPDCALKPATAGQDSVICRIPNHPLALELIRQVNLPLVGPSANTSTKVSGTTASIVEQDLGSKIAGTLDGGPATIGVESTILDCREASTVTILRPGAIGKVELEQALHSPENLKKLGRTITVIESIPNLQQVTPGAKYKHYSPNTPVYRMSAKTFQAIAERLPFHPRSVEIHETSTPSNAMPSEPPQNLAFIGTQEQFHDILTPEQQKILEIEKVLTLPNNIFFLSLGHIQTWAEISQNLYQTLIKLDTLNVSKAYFLDQPFDDSSLSKALQNRLSKIVTEENG
jgi:tRNA threonylcarbamoyl adenosine modification protein (Sua5/YciO/YrdC/YwlC family)